MQEVLFVLVFVASLVALLTMFLQEEEQRGATKPMYPAGNGKKDKKNTVRLN